MTCDEIRFFLSSERAGKNDVLSVNKIWSCFSVRILHEDDRTLSDCQLDNGSDADVVGC